MIALGLVAPAANAATISTTFQLFTPDIYGPDGFGGEEIVTPGTLIPESSPGVYNMLPGTTFKLVVNANVVNPNITDTNHTGVNFDSKPLGIANLNGGILSSGLNVANPVGILRPDLAQPLTPKWYRFTEFIGKGDPAFVNLVDLDADLDLDPAGAGAANSGTTMPVATTPTGNTPSAIATRAAIDASTLASFQAGIGNVPFFSGNYLTGASGSTFLTFTPLNNQGQVFTDPPGGVDGVAVEAAAHTGSPIQIIIAVPEPSTIALAGMGLVGLVFAMRRKTA